MVFSGLTFIFYFLPITLAAYYLLPAKWRNGVLLVANLIFYGWGEPIYVFLMMLSTMIGYVHGYLVDKWRADERKARLVVASNVILNLAILIYFKYAPFIAENLRAIGLTGLAVPDVELPIGISFYTFQTMSYAIDVYRGDARAQKNPATFATFVTLFPQLIAGPILRYKDLDSQLEERGHSTDKFASGAKLFVVGLAKKVLLANNIGMLWNEMSACAPSSLSALGAWLGALAFAFQIYFDFSGYSDMAVGLGRMFGFEFMNNFNYPYISRSVTEFWRRWHISLGTWFRDYLYIPLGGNRRGKARWLLNILIVWGATGIWHGASWNFLIWGLYFAVLLAFEKLFLLKWLERAPKWLGHVYALLAVLMGWVLFASEDIGLALSYAGAMFGGGAGLWASSDVYYMMNYLPMFALLTLASLPLGAKLFARLPEKARGALALLLGAVGFALCVAYLTDATYNPFLYFRF